jgi:hypothetical protein
MEEKEIVEKLSKFDIKPTKQWQEQTLEKLDTVVTNSIDNRNSNLTLSNLFNSINMNIKTRAILTIATVGIVFAALGTVAYASNSATPNDPLFGVDKAIEQMRRTFMLYPLDKAEYEMKVMDERIEELKQMSYEENAQGISEGIKEVEAQMLRLQNMFEQMSQTRVEDEGQEAEKQLQVMNKMAEKLAAQEGTLRQIQDNLSTKGQEASRGEVDYFQEQYTKEVQNRINQFETETGLEVKTNTQTVEQNQGEDSQIQNEIQNEVNTGDSGSDAPQGVQGVQNSNSSNGNGGR